jgi:SNF family Na+-dependent transporter
MGMGISWNFMFPAIPPKVWSIIWLIVALIVVGKGVYERIEFILKLCLTALAITVIILVQNRF